MKRQLFILGLVFIFLISLVSADLTDGNKVYYSFDVGNVTGATLIDQSINSVNATCSNMGGNCNTVSGWLLNATEFNSGLQDVTTNSNPYDINTGDVSVSIWIYPTDNSVSRAIWSNDNAIAGQNNNFRMYLLNTGALRITAKSTSNQNLITGAGFVTLNSWSNILVTLNSGNLSIYRNGTYSQSLAVTGDLSSNANWILGENDAESTFFGKQDEFSIWNRSLNQTEISQIYNSGVGFNPYNVVPPPNITVVDHTIEETVKFSLSNPVAISSTNFSTIVTGTFDLEDAANNTVSWTVNALATDADEELTCRVDINGQYYDTTRSRTMTSGLHGSMYITSTDFNLSSGEHNVTLECKTTTGNNILISNSVGILSVLRDFNTDLDLNYLSAPFSSNINNSSFTKLGEINFTTTNRTVNSTVNKKIVLDGSLQYNYDSTGTITIYTVINGTKMGEYPRYGSIGSNGSIGALMYKNILPNINESQNLTIEIYGKSTTSDGSVSGNFILKEFIMQDDEINTTQLNGTSVTSSVNFTNITTLTVVNEDHAQGNLVVKAGIPIETTSGSATITFKLTIASENGSEMTRDIVAPNQAGVAVIQEVFENLNTGSYDVSLQASNNNSFDIIGGDFTAYFSAFEPFFPDFFVITAQDKNNLSSINTFNVTTDSGLFFNTTTGSIEIFSAEDLINFTVRTNNYMNDVVVNHNTSINYTSNMSFATNTLIFYDMVNSQFVNNASVDIFYPISGDQETIFTDANGQVQFSSLRDGVNEVGNYTFRVNSFQGYITPINITQELNLTNIPFNQTYNLSIANIIINVFDRETGALLNDTTVTLNLIGVFTNTTTNGSFTYNDLTLTPGTYSLQAIATGYYTEQVEFQYTNQENLTVNVNLLNLTSPNFGTLFARVVDDVRFALQQGSLVTLMEYDAATLSYTTVSSCLTNSNGECIFAVELNTKTYTLIASKTISGETFTAESTPEIFRIDNEVRELILQVSEEFETGLINRLVININETFVNNISTIAYNFYTTDNTAVTVCTEYFRLELTNLISVNQTCYTGSAVINEGFQFLLNRSNAYEAQVYLLENGGKQLLQTFSYPSETSLQQILTDNEYLIPVILILFILILVLALYLKSTDIFFYLATFLIIVLENIFPSTIYLSSTVIVFIVSVAMIYTSRKNTTEI